jgi:hypothetical protein
MQAAPLAGRLKHSGGVLQRIEELHLEPEREVMSRILNEHSSNVSIRFVIATIKSVGDVFRKYKRGAYSSVPPILHFSCHGAKTFLALEDGVGGIQPLTVEILREWLQDTGIKFVFVAACCSKSIGELFQMAGVDHVICAARDDMEIQSGFFLEFSKVLYESLISGDTVKNAFRDAELHVSALRCFEKQALCLIGAHTDHGVAVFNGDSQPVTCQSSPRPKTAKQPVGACPKDLLTASQESSFFQNQPAAIRYNGRSFVTSKSTFVFSRYLSEPSNGTSTPIQSPEQRKSDLSPKAPNQQKTIMARLKRHYTPPRPPHHYARYDDVNFQIIQAVNISPLVWITGQEPKCGKSTALKASLSYLKYRLKENKLDDILWTSEGKNAGKKHGFASLLEDIEKIPTRRFLVAIEAKSLPPASQQELAQKLMRLVEHTTGIKLVVILEECDRDNLGVGKHSCNERSLKVSVLNPESIVKLFARFCPYVDNGIESDIQDADSLWELVAPQNADSLCLHGPREQPTASRYPLPELATSIDRKYTPRMRVLLKLMGGHIPMDVMKTAKHMEVGDYRKLICLGRYAELDDPQYESRNELLKLQLRVALSMIASARTHQHNKAIALQMKLDCIEMVKCEVESLQDMTIELTKIEGKMRQAFESKQMDPFLKNFNARNSTWARLQREVDAVLDSPAPFKKFDLQTFERCCQRQDAMEKILSEVRYVHMKVAAPYFSFEGEPNFSKIEKLLASAVAGELDVFDRE